MLKYFNVLHTFRALEKENDHSLSCPSEFACYGSLYLLWPSRSHFFFALKLPADLLAPVFMAKSEGARKEFE